MCSTQGAEAGLAEPVAGEKVKGRQNAGVSPGPSPTRHVALPVVCAREPEAVTGRGPAGGEEGQQDTCSHICSPDPWCLGGGVGAGQEEGKEGHGKVRVFVQRCSCCGRRGPDGLPPGTPSPRSS